MRSRSRATTSSTRAPTGATRPAWTFRTRSTEAPPVAGPSVLALSITPVAIPDSISQDGASQSSITVTALDANGRPIAGLVLRVDMSVGGVVQDFGTLSARSIVTGTDGKART